MSQDFALLSEKALPKAIFGCVFCHAGVNLTRMGDLCVCRRCAGRLYEAEEGAVLYPTAVE